MRAVVFDGGGVLTTQVPDARLVDPDDAVVEVSHAAVCGTDLHLLAHPSGLQPGTVLGHEFVGRVRSVGARVRSVRIGDRVVCADYTACGLCWWCRGGLHWQCPDRAFFGTGTSFGTALPGGQAEQVRVPFADTCLRPLPADLDSSHALLLGDTLATGFAAVEALRAAPGELIAVIGGGPVGQLSALNAQLAGATQVVLVEPVAERRDLAARLGCVAVDPEQARQVIGDLTDGRGADAVVDAVGAPIGLDTALGLVRDAGTIASVGVPATPTHDLDVARAFARELTLRFVIGNFSRDADRLISLLSSGLIPAEDLLDPGFTLQEAPDAYAAMRARRAGKAVLTL